jgi:limonene-1,2-epoxide hydrolase
MKRSRKLSRSAKLMMLGTGVASIAAILLTSACASKRVDLLSNGRDALDRTENDGKETMSAHPEKVDKALQRFDKLFADFKPQAVSDGARWLYAPDVYFNDGFAELKGSDAVARYLGRSAGHTAEIEVELEEITKTADAVYVRWIMTFTTTGGTTVVAPGISHLRFNQDGRITYHRDYWDAGSALAEFVPLAGAMLRAVKSRL